MDIPLNVHVHCSDGRCGRSTRVVLNPATEQLTHIVVRERGHSRIERMVPIELVANTAAEVIVLRCTKEEFLSLSSFHSTDFIYTEIPQYATDPKLTAIWPYVVPVKRIIDDTIERIPPGELAVRRGAKVLALDGQVGRVDEFIVGPKSGNITHLCLREGHLWGQVEICVPVSFIDHIEGNIVHLNVDKKTIESMPAVPVNRLW
jgi:sporulation protein YlmC with PRC-barrel domain